jgi:phosphoglycerate kinase
MAKLSIRDLELKNKRVFMRVDFNVPLDEHGRVTDDTRIVETLPTIDYALQHRAHVILASHLGRPKGKPNPKMSLRPVAEHLRILLDKTKSRDCNVGFSPDCVGWEAEEMVKKLEPGQLLLLENLRFHAEEEANDENFAKSLAKLADLYVNDAFGAAHRAHASTAAIARLLPSAAGLLMQREIEVLSGLLEAPKKPFGAIIGGAKISSKIGVLEQLLARIDLLVLGGAMANTFLKAQGYDVGVSLVEDDQLAVARQTLQTAEQRGVQVILPIDVVIADRFAADAEHRVVAADGILPGWTVLDVGPRTVDLIGQAVTRCATVLWNGPLGMFEFPAFAGGTLAVAHMLADAPGIVSVVGGGESVAAVEQAGLAARITHVSTGGGASLELLEGKTLPGVAALAQA